MTTTHLGGSPVELLRVAAVLAQRGGGPERRILAQILASIAAPARAFEDPRFQRLCPQLAALLGQQPVVAGVAQELAGWRERGIEATALGEDRYPLRLRSMYDPPLLLFHRGQLEALNSKIGFLAIVGSRSADAVGCAAAAALARELAACGLCIVSGLAYGIDGKAHQGALEGAESAATIAVLGNGLGRIYPAGHERLARDIVAAGGVILSHFEPALPAYPSNFLDRNRVIAGLSDAVLVVQAALRSGSLVTARYALEEGRDVLAVPGAVGDPRHAGTNRLIQQGAALVTSAEEVLAYFPAVKIRGPGGAQDRAGGAVVGADAKARILAVLRTETSIHREALALRVGRPPDFNRDLLELELAGRIELRPGNQIALRPGS